MSKTAFAGEVGLSRTSLFHILKGQSLPKRSTLERFIRVTSLEGDAAKELIHLFETERIHTIQTTRKEVRSEREVFRSKVFAELEQAGSCSLDDSRLPDFWFKEGGQAIPVFAEGKITDHYNLLGRAQALRSKLGKLKAARWQAWVCVSEMEGIYSKYQEEFEPFGLKIGIVGDLLANVEPEQIPQDEQDAPLLQAPTPEQGHFQFSIECD